MIRPAGSRPRGSGCRAGWWTPEALPAAALPRTHPPRVHRVAQCLSGSHLPPALSLWSQCTAMAVRKGARRSSSSLSPFAILHFPASAAPIGYRQLTGLAHWPDTSHCPDQSPPAIVPGTRHQGLKQRANLNVCVPGREAEAERQRQSAAAATESRALWCGRHVSNPSQPHTRAAAGAKRA